MYKEKVFDSSIGDANKWLNDYKVNFANMSDRTMKSFKERIKVYENRFRYEEENFQLDRNDMFTVFGKEIATQMLLSKIPKFKQIKAMQKRLE